MDKRILPVVPLKYTRFRVELDMVMEDGSIQTLVAADYSRAKGHEINLVGFTIAQKMFGTRDESHVHMNTAGMDFSIQVSASHPPAPFGAWSIPIEKAIEHAPNWARPAPFDSGTWNEQEDGGS